MSFVLIFFLLLLHTFRILINDIPQFDNFDKLNVKVKQSCYRPGVAERFPGSQGSKIS
jgi:hypothetical protein